MAVGSQMIVVLRCALHTAAVLDGTQHFQMLPGQPATALLNEVSTDRAKACQPPRWVAVSPLLPFAREFRFTRVGKILRFQRARYRLQMAPRQEEIHGRISELCMTE
jgi:hypothetical protein